MLQLSSDMIWILMEMVKWLAKEEMAWFQRQKEEKTSLRRTPLSFAVSLMQNLEWSKVAKDIWCPWQLCDRIFFCYSCFFFSDRSPPAEYVVKARLKFYPNKRWKRSSPSDFKGKIKKIKCGREKSGRIKSRSDLNILPGHCWLWSYVAKAFNRWIAQLRPFWERYHFV